MFELGLESQVFVTTENYAQQAENNTGFFGFLPGITTIGNKIKYVYISTTISGTSLHKK